MRTRKKKQKVETIPVPEGWIEESPGVYVARESAPLTSEESASLAKKVEEVEGLLEKIDDKDYLIYYADEDFLEAEVGTAKIDRSAALVLEKAEHIDGDEFDPAGNEAKSEDTAK